METLPVEMVELIVQQLTPQDLARCSAVCREWRDIFNQDWMWRPHCDPELEEPLRTIPCVATPAFVTPEAENSTLSPNCSWKMAFMRENHLWQNWGNKETMEYKEENAIESLWNNEVLDIDFLTDTLVVVWYSNCIQIWDVSVMPAALVSKTDTSDNTSGRRRVVGTSILLVERYDSADVFIVDIMKKTIIQLNHSISLDSTNCFPACVVKEQFYICVIYDGKQLKIFDLYTGEILKKEPCPVKVNYQRLKCQNVKSSPNSDFVAVQYAYDYDSVEYYIYNLKQLTFLPGPVAKAKYSESDIGEPKLALHGHWLAFIDHDTLKVYNFLSREILLSHKLDCYASVFGSTLRQHGFIVIGYKIHTSWVKCYFPLDRTLSTLYEDSRQNQFKMRNKKFLAVFNKSGKVLESVLRLSGQTVTKCDMSAVRYRWRINQSSTRVLKKVYLKDLGRTWYVSCLW